MPSSEDVSGWQTVSVGANATPGPGLACIVSEISGLPAARALADKLNQGFLRCVHIRTVHVRTVQVK